VAEYEPSLFVEMMICGGRVMRFVLCCLSNCLEARSSVTVRSYCLFQECDRNRTFTSGWSTLSRNR